MSTTKDASGREYCCEERYWLTWSGRGSCSCRDCYDCGKTFAETLPVWDEERGHRLCAGCLADRAADDAGQCPT